MKYAKFVVAFAVAALTAVTSAISDNTISPAEWVTIILAGLGALGVYLVPNKPAPPVPAPYKNGGFPPDRAEL